MVVVADPGLVLSVLRNLIGNALKYTERGGVLVAARRRQSSVLIQVWDTGIGIEARYGEQIFDEFLSRSATTPRPEQGAAGAGIWRSPGGWRIGSA